MRIFSPSPNAVSVNQTPVRPPVSTKSTQSVSPMSFHSVDTVQFSGKQDKALHAAIAQDDIHQTEQLLRSGVEVDRINSRNLTPLLTAVEHDQPRMVNLLIDKGANYNQLASKHHFMPLHFAVVNGKLNAAKTLIHRGANLNQDSDFGSPMHLAAMQGHVELIPVMAEKGGDVNLKSQYKGVTPLIVATTNNDMAAAQALLNAGADKDQLSEGNNVLHVAAFNGYTELVKLFGKDNPNIDQPHHEGATALALAAAGGHTDTMKALLEMGANINYQNRDGVGIPHYAASSGNLDTVQALLDARANINAQDAKGRLPVDYAKNRKVRKLLEQAMKNNTTH